MSTEAAVISPRETYGSITRHITDTVLKPTGWGWWIGFVMAGGLASVLGVSLFWLFYKGVGIWGINMPVAWGTAIINYVWWIEIAQGGTFISAVLLLLHQKWRNSVNRFTEAMTLFALACAGLFPLLHLGRPQYAFFLAPYPNTLAMWPQFVSPLVWDFFAVSIYATVSVLFWYVGMIPDLATLRDTTTNLWLRRLYSVASLGWRNSAAHWHQYETASKIIAALCAPLVISVHSIVGLDFAYTILPGWHSTIFTPFFVVGAIFSGLRHGADAHRADPLALPLGERHHDEPPQQHGQAAPAHGHVRALRSSERILYGLVQRRSFTRSTRRPTRCIGIYAPAFYISMGCTVRWPSSPSGSARSAAVPFGLFVISVLVNVGMWAERYLNIVGSLHRDFLTSSWGDLPHYGLGLEPPTLARSACS